MSNTFVATELRVRDIDASGSNVDYRPLEGAYVEINLTLHVPRHVSTAVMTSIMNLSIQIHQQVIAADLKAAADAKATPVAWEPEVAGPPGQASR